MTLAVDITDGHSLSNESDHQLLPKKSKVMLYLPSLHSRRHLFSCTLLTRRRASVLKVRRHAVWVAKLIKEDWLSVTLRISAQKQLYTTFKKFYYSSTGV